MLILDFKTTMERCKEIKSPIVTTSWYDPTTLLGTNADLNILRVMQTTERVPNLEPGEWIYLAPIPSDIDISGPVVKELLGVYNRPIREFYVDLNRELNIKYQRAKDYLAISTEYVRDDDFKARVEFEGFNQMKATDGALCIRYSPKMCFFIYKGLIPYNKADDISMSIYPGATDFMVAFTTHRKKGYNITTFVKYLYTA